MTSMRFIGCLLVAIAAKGEARSLAPRALLSARRAIGAGSGAPRTSNNLQNRLDAEQARTEVSL